MFDLKLLDFADSLKLHGENEIRGDLGVYYLQVNRRGPFPHSMIISLDKVPVFSAGFANREQAIWKDLLNRLK